MILLLLTINARNKKIIEYLLIMHEYVTILDIENNTGITRRSIYYDLNKINEWLNENHIKKIDLGKEGILLGDQQRMDIENLLNNFSKNSDYIFSPKERLSIIICFLLLANNSLYVDFFAHLCDVSRNTILQDFKSVKTQLTHKHLELSYSMKFGYSVKGDVLTKRSLFFTLFMNIIQLFQDNVIIVENKEKIDVMYAKLNSIAEELEVTYVSGTLYSLAFFLSYVSDETEKVDFSEDDENKIRNSKEYNLINKYFKDLDDNEKIYLSLHLLGSRLQTASVNISNNQSDEDVDILSVGLVKEFCRIACIEAETMKSVVQPLSLHLKSSLWRYKYGIQLGNPMLEEIKNNYNDLFLITKKACEFLEKKLVVSIPDSEIAFITLHFGAYLDYKSHEAKNIKVQIICPNGISTGNMLKREIALLLPNAYIIDVCSSNDYKSFSEYDLIISTVILKGKRNFDNQIVVHPILSDDDKVHILRKCIKFSSNNKSIVNVVRNIAKKYIDPGKLNEFTFEVEKLFSPQNDEVMCKNDLLTLLENNEIMFVEEDYGWEFILQKLGSNAVKKNIISQSYIDSIIIYLKRYGSYMFVNDEVILAHAKVEDGSNKLAIQMAICKKPITFPGNKKAKIIFLLSTIDQSSHIGILKDIISICSDREYIQNLVKSENKTDLLNMIKEKL